MPKLTLCVIFGGVSPEHEISRRSVTSVLENLDKEKYEIITLGITKQGKWLKFDGDYKEIINGDWEKSEYLTPAVISPDRSEKSLICFENDGVKKIKLDVVFPVLHGENGEDGTIQGLLELAGIPYVGMGVIASANGMDKSFTKLVFANAGIPQADWVVVLSRELDEMEKVIDNIENKLGFPCFVKPCNTGSSVGVSKAKDRGALKEALLEAAKFDTRILVEEFIDGRELECAVIGNENPRAGEVGEIIPMVEFYDYDAKYNDNSTKLEIPAKTDNRELIREYAVKAFKALCGTGLSRVDFFEKKSDKSLVLNEVNTMPGFTSISMYPKLMMATGMTYSQILDELISLGLEKKGISNE